MDINHFRDNSMVPPTKLDNPGIKLRFKLQITQSA